MGKKKKKLVETTGIQITDKVIADIQGALIDTSPHNAFEQIVESYEEALESQQMQKKDSEGKVYIQKRFIDNMAMLKKADNFVLRKHFGKTVPLFVTYVVVFLLSMGFLVVNEANTMLVIIVSLLIGAAALVNIYYLKKFHRINNAIEFQNYIYANAMRSDNEFCLIFNEEGEVVYTDPRLENLVTTEESKSVSPIDLLLLSFEVSPDKIDAIKGVVFRNQGKEQITEDSNVKGDLNTLILQAIKTRKGTYTISVFELNNPVGYTTLKMTKIDDGK